MFLHQYLATAALLINCLSIVFGGNAADFSIHEAVLRLITNKNNLVNVTKLYSDAGNPIKLKPADLKIIRQKMHVINNESLIPWFKRDLIRTNQHMTLCTEHLVCSENDRKLWQARRDFVEVLVEINNAIGMEEVRIINNSSVLASISEFISPVRALLPDDAFNYHHVLCNDENIAGFLLNNDSVKWPISCVWSGSDRNGTCAPAPLTSNTTFDYIHRAQWTYLLSNFRSAIGCSEYEIANLNNTNEVFFCRERCTSLGIGVLPMYILMASTMVIIALACSEEAVPRPLPAN